jgi:hypothetical protein
MVILFRNYTPNKKYDLKLYAKRKTGYECQVSLENKYCAYAKFVEDKE